MPIERLRNIAIEQQWPRYDAFAFDIPPLDENIYASLYAMAEFLPGKGP